MLRLLCLFLCLLPAAAMADRCRAVVNGSEIVVEEENFSSFSDQVGTAEKLLSWPSRRWDKTWGTPPACRSGVIYDYLASTVAPEGIEGYCLSHDEEAGYVLAPGERNFRGLCKKTICERVDSTAQETAAVTATLARSALATAREPDQLRAVMHQSGALILSGSASTISATLGNAGTGLMTALSTPAALTAVGVSVLAVGGAVYMCSVKAAVSSDG